MRGESSDSRVIPQAWRNPGDRVRFQYGDQVAEAVGSGRAQHAQTVVEEPGPQRVEVQDPLDAGPEFCGLLRQTFIG